MLYKINGNNGVVISGERLYGSCDVTDVKMEILVVNVFVSKNRCID